jgi:predicted small lipoprotein YifL
MRLQNAATLLLLLSAAAGCGQKGPLYLPGDPNEGRIVLPEELGGPAEDDGAEETDGPGEQDEAAGDEQQPDDEERDGTGDER